MKTSIYKLIIGALVIIVVFLLGSHFSPNTLFKNFDEILPTPTPVVTVAPTSDPDPIVTCNIHANCGGGTKTLRKSECDNSVCCRLPNGDFVYYSDKSQCNNDQKVLNANTQIAIPTTASKIAVYLTYSGQTLYCKPEGVDAIKSADNYNSKLLGEYKTCIGQASIIYATCTNNCSINDPTDTCRNSCNERYSYKNCTKPDEASLNNLLNQYCR